jgi:hypothetical protein
MTNIKRKVPENLRNEQATETQPAQGEGIIEKHRALSCESERPLRRLCVSVQEAAAMLGVSPISIYRAIQRGLLKSSNAFRHKLIPVTELERFVKTTTNTILLLGLVSVLVGESELQNAKFKVSASSVAQLGGQV